MHSTYRLATHELQDDKLSVRKATLPCKKQGFLTLGALRPGLTPPVYPTCCNPVCLQMLFSARRTRRMALGSYDPIAFFTPAGLQDQKLDRSCKKPAAGGGWCTGNGSEDRPC